MRKLVIGCAVAGLIALSPKSEARSPLSSLSPRRSVVPKEQPETGEASWYGEEFEGNTTASGEVYDSHGLTAAHPTLPFGTTVRVTNLSNSRHVLLRINDRGPYIGRRLIDVSQRAAKRLGFIDSGTTPVRVEVVARPSSNPTSGIDLISQTRPSSCPARP
ncbi:MAG: septal ring lytic transglycosylase RlpA family protein [Terriglobia bacterium]|jgi:rare lipoprotein A